MTEAQEKALNELRKDGHVVVTFSPSELRGACPRDVTDRCIERGNEEIENLATEPNPDQEE